MNAMKVLFGACLVLLAMLVSPALMANVASGAAGLLLVASVSLAGVGQASAAVQPVALPPVAQMAEVRRVMLDNGRGVVEFRLVGSKMVSRMYRV